MEYAWRDPLMKAIRERYMHNTQAWFKVAVNTNGLLDITIVSDRFEGMHYPQRREAVHTLLREFQAPTSTGFLSLYTLEEAKMIGLHQPSADAAGEEPAYNWYDLATQAANPDEQILQPEREPRLPRTIAFYSFKGGVGRTTALTHVATILAMRGLTVVAVDLDLEAPGLSKAFNLTPTPEYGIIDYFYERAFMPEEEGLEPTIAISQLFSEVPIPNASGQLFVVPAGELDLEYLAKVDDLRASTTPGGEDLWTIFYRDINEQLQPDVILVDSRTGINQWGAFSLLRAADHAIIFLFPNDQNRQGIEMLMQALSHRVPTSFVFSPVPTIGGVGQEIVRRQWEAMYPIVNHTPIPPSGKIPEPIIIPYMTEIALASSYPIYEVLAFYTAIADLVDVDTTTLSIKNILSNVQSRHNVLKSFDPKELDATKEESIYHQFQPTSDFDKILEERISLIHGQKGTGKSALYWLYLKHKANADDLTYGKSNHIRCISGHGPFRPGPGIRDFRYIDQKLLTNVKIWDTFWPYYLLCQLATASNIERSKESPFRDLFSLFDELPQNIDNWGKRHNDTLVNLIMRDGDKGISVRELLSRVDTRLKEQKHVYWILYDGLDKDIPSNIRDRALMGLFQFIRTSRFKNIHFKVFLREDIWSQLAFSNKNYFNGRDVLLTWTELDFQRLVLRYTLQSQEFRKLVNQISPIEDIDSTSEETISKALQLLWGSRLEDDTLSPFITDWLYEHITDRSNTTFPHTVSVLLREAIKSEMQASQASIVQRPTDRLLAISSLREGLLKAAQERCREMSETYPELQPFFAALAGKNKVLAEDDLREIWQGTVQSTQPDFVRFVNYLRAIGILMNVIGPNKQAYLFMSLYADGFGMNSEGAGIPMEGFVP